MENIFDLAEIRARVGALRKLVLDVQKVYCAARGHAKHLQEQLAACDALIASLPASPQREQLSLASGKLHEALEKASTMIDQGDALMLPAVRQSLRSTFP